MGPELLPVEKIPVFIWGAVIVLIGAYLLWNDDVPLIDQWKNIALIVIGLIAMIYDIRRRLLGRK